MRLKGNFQPFKIKHLQSPIPVKVGYDNVSKSPLAYPLRIYKSAEQIYRFSILLNSLLKNGNRLYLNPDLHSGY